MFFPKSFPVIASVAYIVTFLENYQFSYFAYTAYILNWEL